MSYPIARLDTLCKAVNVGHVGPSSMHRQADGVPFVMGKDVRVGFIATEDLDRVTEEFHRGQPKSQIRAGDVVVVRIGKSGQAAKVPETLGEANCSGLVIIKKPQIDADFLVYFLNSPIGRSHSLAQTRGSTRPTLNTKSVAEMFVPNPHLAEQRRIVTILDEAFAGLAIARANAEKNLKNARELFESYLNSVFGQKGRGWEKTRLGSEIDLLVGFAFKSPHYTKSADGIRLLRGDNVIQNALRWNDVKRWPAADAGKYENYNLKVGDVVLAMDRTWVKAGLKYAVIEKSDIPCLLVQRVARLRCRNELANRFLVHLIGSPKFTEYVLRIQTGLSVPHISGKQISDFVFWKPSISEQRRIGSEIDDLAFKIVRLEETYEEKLSALTNLRQSILQKAFSGELTSPPSQAIKEAAE